MKKIIFIIGVFSISISHSQDVATPEASQPAAQTETVVNNESQRSRFIPRLALESLDLKEYDDNNNVNKLNRDTMYGLNLGVAYEFNLSDRVSTYTIPNLTYARINDATKDADRFTYSMKNFVYKLNQTINFNLPYKNFIFQPYLGLGFGYGWHKYTYDYDSGLSQSNKREGTLFEQNFGMQFIGESWTPFFQYTTRQHKVSKFTAPNGNEIKVDKNKYNSAAVTIGAGHRF